VVKSGAVKQTNKQTNQWPSNLGKWGQMPRPGNLLILGDIQQVGQGHRTFWLITLELFDRLASNLIQWKRS